MSGATAPDGTRRLLGTKLHAPRRRRQLVSRHRLAHALAAHDSAALALVSAPAGFGKSTLLSDWFEQAQRPGRSTAVWFSLDPGDNDPARFGAYLVAALGAVVPVEIAEAASRGGQDVGSIAAALLDEIACATIEVTLLIDDYHLIDDVDIHEAISLLVERAPGNFHLVLATRSDPPLPLARWRARGMLLEVRAADLRFTIDEAATYFHDAMALTLTPDDVAALEARTEGWIAAMQLAALSLQGRSDVHAFIDSFTGDDRFVLDYLVEEVLERQAPPVRRFLLATSVLDRLSGALCDAVTESSTGKAMLELLDRANLFLVPLDDRRQWYRYHHLFADALRARLIDEAPDDIQELHRRASEWWAANDEPAEAVAHALSGGHVDLAARLIELAAPTMRQSRQDATLRRWLEVLPEDVFENRPVLAMALVGARMATGDVVGVDVLLDRIETAIARPAPTPIAFDLGLYERLPAQIAIQRAGLALLAGDVDATIARATDALDLVDSSDHYRRASATALLALARWTLGDLQTATRHYQAAIAGFIEADHIADMLGCSLALGDIQIVQGNLSDAMQTFENGLRWTTTRPGLRGAADMHIGLSEVLIERNQLDAAGDHLETSRELGEAAGLPQHAYRWGVTMARLCRARGEVDRALALIAEAAPRYDTDFSPPVRPIHAIRARVQLARGDLDAALKWAAESGLTPDDDLDYVHEYEHTTLARILIARSIAEHDQALLDAAIELLDRLLTAALSGGRAGSVIEILILRAAAFAACGNERQAAAAIEDALHRSEAEGHVRLFLHAGPDVADLVRLVASRTDATPHARRVLAALDVGISGPTPAAATTTRAPMTTPTDLSRRELEVLRLLRSDLSGPEVARELHISVNTLRTHTKSIFTKLGATNRREALRRAADRGL